MAAITNIEGQRIQIKNVNFMEVTFKTRHDALPVVTTELEVGGSESAANITTFIYLLTQTHVGVQFSEQFNGYLHLHAFSRAVP